jgi:hypothetical protein
MDAAVMTGQEECCYDELKASSACNLFSGLDIETRLDFTPRSAYEFEYVKKTPLAKLVEPTDPAEHAQWHRNRLAAMERSKPGDDAQVTRRPKMYVPPNDPGFHRAVTNPRGDRIIGAMYHPLGNPSGFARAPLEPLDRTGREAVRRYQDMTPRPMEQGVAKQGSWPPRGW